MIFIFSKHDHDDQTSINPQTKHGWFNSLRSLFLVFILIIIFSPVSLMGSVEKKVVLDFPPYRLYKNGSFERLAGTEIVPPSLHPDPQTGVSSKDVTIDPETGVYVRLFLPNITTTPNQKLPLLVYFHGGGFCIESPSSPLYHNYVSSVVSKAKVVAVSVGYRLAPEHVVPAAHNDSWAALQWVASHAKGEGSEPWLKKHANLDRVFMAGDSAGGNIVHNVAMRAMETPLEGVKIVGLVLMHPYFSGPKPTDSELSNPDLFVKASKLWSLVACPNCGNDHPLLDPNRSNVHLAGFPCKRVLVCIAGNDILRDRDRLYCKFLKERGWEAEVEKLESQGEGHVFHLLDPTCEKALVLMGRFVSFIKQG